MRVLYRNEEKKTFLKDGCRQVVLTLTDREIVMYVTISRKKVKENKSRSGTRACTRMHAMV